MLESASTTQPDTLLSKGINSTGFRALVTVPDKVAVAPAPVLGHATIKVAVEVVVVVDVGLYTTVTTQESGEVPARIDVHVLLNRKSALLGPVMATVKGALLTSPRTLNVRGNVAIPTVA
jgi:hypothetical protein